MITTDERPRTLTIEEAAHLLGIGRSLAYSHARERGELAGIPVLRIGRRMLVPTAALDRLLGDSLTTNCTHDR